MTDGYNSDVGHGSANRIKLVVQIKSSQSLSISIEEKKNWGEQIYTRKKWEGQEDTKLFDQ